MSQESLKPIQPIILAGGLGTRLRPRTNYLPKPLLPIAGRPILWYTLNSLNGHQVRPPIVALDYLGELIEAYFSGSPVRFVKSTGKTMAGAVLSIAEGFPCDSYLGMSADVLLAPSAVTDTVRTFDESDSRDTVLFVRLPSPGHKKWNFVVEGGRLLDIGCTEARTPYERLLLILRRDSLTKARQLLGEATQEGLPLELRGFQTGWILLLKALVFLGVDVRAKFVELPVCNVNEPADFHGAEQFVEKFLS